METAMADDVLMAMMDPATRLDPYPLLDRFRATDHVVDTGLGMWFVFGYDDCLALLRDRRSSVARTPVVGEVPDDEPSALIHLDPPDHTRLRALVQPTFTPRRVDALRARAVQLVDTTLSQFGVGDEIDIVEQLAFPIPFTIICDLLGIPEGDRALVGECSHWMAQVVDPPVLISDEVRGRAIEAQSAFVALLHDLIAFRRINPTDDLLSQLVEVQSAGNDLADRDLIGLAVLILVAGHETTVNLVGNGTLALLRNEDQARHVARRECDPRVMVDELLRYDSPVQMTARTATEPIELSGTTLPVGMEAIALLGSANRDPSAFDRPQHLDVMTPRTAMHLSLGMGIHHCLGAALARAEGEVMVGELFRRFPNIELVSEGAIKPTFVLRGRSSLRVRLA
jgi:pimeloyl-[acyl-carrier protein] synthase